MADQGDNPPPLEQGEERNVQFVDANHEPAQVGDAGAVGQNPNIYTTESLINLTTRAKGIAGNGCRGPCTPER
jgi:hypothetical protein